MKNFHFTIDCDYIPNTNIVFGSLIEFIEKNELDPTFFLAGKFAKSYPSLARDIAQRFEIGSHGYYHGLCPRESFSNNVSYEDQKNCLIKSTKTIEEITTYRPNIFRAPYLQISDKTFKILKELNYTIDSSIPARRFDFFLGSINNPKYFARPREPRFLNNGIYEIPPSAFIFPLNMRFVKLFGAKRTCKHINLFFKNMSTIVFYMHPCELVENRRILEYPLKKDYFYKNGGKHLFNDLNYIIRNIKKLGFSPTSMKTACENNSHQ